MLVGTSRASMSSVEASVSSRVSRMAGSAFGFCSDSSSGAAVIPSPGRVKPNTAAAIQGRKKKMSATTKMAVVAALPPRPPELLDVRVLTVGAFGRSITSCSATGHSFWSAGIGCP